jgi:hypothetical protein
MLRRLTPGAAAARLLHREKLQRRRRQRRLKPQRALVLRWRPGEAAEEVVRYVCTPTRTVKYVKLFNPRMNFQKVQYNTQNTVRFGR